MEHYGLWAGWERVHGHNNLPAPLLVPTRSRQDFLCSPITGPFSGRVNDVVHQSANLSSGLDLLIVRHAESEGNTWWHQTIGAGMPEEEARKWFPGLDPPLTARGHRQAELFSRWLVGCYRPTGIYSSTLSRSKETVRAIFKACGESCSVVYLDSLCEYIGPPTTGIWRDGPPLRPYVRAEPPAAYTEFCQKVLEDMETLMAEQANSVVIIVTHLWTINAILQAVLGTWGVWFHHNNTGWTHLRWQNGRWEVLGVNRLDHLMLAGETELITS